MNDILTYNQIVPACLIGFFAAYLFVLLQKRDLILRFTAAEAAFYLRIGMPANLVHASRRLAEGSLPVYLAAGFLCLNVITFVTGPALG
jgi:hypothetical protein